MEEAFQNDGLNLDDLLYGILAVNAEKYEGLRINAEHFYDAIVDQYDNHALLAEAGMRVHDIHNDSLQLRDLLREHVARRGTISIDTHGDLSFDTDLATRIYKEEIQLGLTQKQENEIEALSDAVYDSLRSG